MFRDTLRRRVELIAGGIVCLAICPFVVAEAAPMRDHQAQAANNREHHDHPEYHFRTEDRERLYSHYKDSEQWLDRRDRHEYYEGQRLEGDWETGMKPIPQDYTQELPPAPQGYVFGYSDGYAVAFNPTTHIVADVIDLAATSAAQ